jgi:uncharacterized membrane-anchored protein
MRQASLSLGIMALAVALAFGVEPGHAQHAKPPAPKQQAQPAPVTPPKEDRYGALLRQGTMGPASIPLRNQAALDLPDGFAFIPHDPGKTAMESLGNHVTDNFLGLVVPSKPASWFMLVEYMPAGYIKDDDAQTWDADQLLSDIKTTTDEANKQRTAQKIPALDIVGWVEKPHYDEFTHRLIWSIVAHDEGVADTADDVINYRTLMLGREGYIALTMVTSQSLIDPQRPIATLLLSKLNFVPGKRYDDFNVSTDHVAEYGLAALIAGVAAKKLGLLAVGLAFAAKFAKVGIVAVLAFLAGIRKLFRRRASKPVITPPITRPRSPTETDPTSPP